LAPQSIEEYLIDQLVSDRANTQLLRSFLEKLDRDVIVDLFEKHLDKKKPLIWVPASVFWDRRVGALEAIVKYLRQEGFPNCAIAELTGRSPQVTSATYRVAFRKAPEIIKLEKSIDIPLNIIRSKLSVLESIVTYLRGKEMTYHEIAIALHRDERTIWTVHRRAKQKHA